VAPYFVSVMMSYKNSTVSSYTRESKATNQKVYSCSCICSHGINLTETCFICKSSVKQSDMSHKKFLPLQPFHK
jgi:hypothetical protein